MYASNMEVRDEVKASLGSRTTEATRAVVIQIGPDQTETDQPSARNRSVSTSVLPSSRPRGCQ